MRGKQRRGEVSNEKTFKQAAELFVREYAVITKGKRNLNWGVGHKARSHLFLLPFFGRTDLSQHSIVLTPP